MPRLVMDGATLQCSMGSSSAKLKVTPAHQVDNAKSPMATVDDHQPEVNIPAFGRCRSLMNPQVAQATAAANGALSPQPCQPMTMAPWNPGLVRVTLNGNAALHETSTCDCLWGGTVSVTHPANEMIKDDYP